ncbi:MAG: nucleotidyltransferase family protein, partial [Pseudomonadales bacterium]
LGMGHSLANAIGEVQDWQAAFIVLGDMPFVAQQTLEALKAACQTAPAGAIIVPAFKGALGHPVGFHRSHFNEIAALSGDKGARSVIDAHPTQVIQVAVEDEGILRDIDQPKDLN